ncbi:tryptophan halogenase family protein [Thalassotalea sp. PS06]|uniref:tryptophan halogenase family protein n=1 Tax=Thalassotalea sp. PS06 TaxID=2594005 RepID=UPI001164E32B|nr:tryptophan halogenase family protein [Thalassotalea sp. PS06]QDP02152.1 tryptophan 7-halogenase [Thalassotalea sp. PS06]
MEKAHLIVLGGGTAGWMSALLMAKKLGVHANITLVESPDIPVIGVGEGTTPYIKQFFKQLDIAEQDWMPACQATYKCGIRFPDWSTKNQYQSYFHPFFSPLDKQVGEAFFHNANCRRAGIDVDANPNHYFVTSYLAKQGLSPHCQQPLPFELDYAYHFDAGLLGTFLQSIGTKMGVTHQQCNIIDVERHLNGDIAAIISDQGERLTADYFIDCSGFRGQLIEQTLDVPFYSYASSLKNNAAVAIQVEHQQPSKLPDKLPTETRSSALANGWMWNIPLTQRWGNGYVYSRDYLNQEQAERELRTALGISDEISARHLSMKVGRRQEHWRNNVFAIGLSQGFVEPLEATALMLVQYTIEHACEAIAGQLGGEVARLNDSKQKFNDTINDMFDGVRDYILVHYLTNSRNDSQYWLDSRNELYVPDAVQHLLEVWQSDADIDKELEHYFQTSMYSRASWYCLLAGMGVFPKVKQRSVQVSAQIAPLQPVVKYNQNCTQHFRAQQDVLAGY